MTATQLVGIVPAEPVRDEISQRERVFGNYEDGRASHRSSKWSSRSRSEPRVTGCWEWKPDFTELTHSLGRLGSRKLRT